MSRKNALAAIADKQKKQTTQLNPNLMIEITNEDNMELMKRYPDNYFDLAIVDPPYRDKNQPTKEMRNKVSGDMKDFGLKPNESYFKELFRVSKNQIVWGGNNFLEHLYSTNCFIFWYKRNPMKNYSDGELAWTSFNTVAKCLPLDHFGAHTSDNDKIHPTQKPVALYEWIFSNYAKEGFKILDTHIGSGSIAIAMDNMNKIEKMNLSLVGCELDKKHFVATMKRIKEQTSWQSLF
jgi:site-specific DNA-methyltransferase (adenine-specific)